MLLKYECISLLQIHDVQWITFYIAISFFPDGNKIENIFDLCASFTHSSFYKRICIGIKVRHFMNSC